MTPVVIVVLTLVAVAGLGALLALRIAADGRGHRPPPRSRHDWTEDVPGVPRR